VIEPLHHSIDTIIQEEPEAHRRDRLDALCTL
jgi:hypothetical protein